MTHSTVPSQVGHWVDDHPAVVRVARAGWLAKGVVYLLAGVLALTVAVRSRGWSTAAPAGQAEASPDGAMATIAHRSGGPLLLAALAIGMVLYAVWRLVAASLPGAPGPKAWLTRAGYVVSAVVYLVLASTAVSLARRPTKPTDGDGRVRDLTARTMQHAAGRWLIGAIGVVIVGAGLYHVVAGLKRDVTKELRAGRMGPARRRLTRLLGAVGEVGRGVAMGLIGVFLVRAAVTFDPSEAAGLDDALRRLVVTGWGLWVVVLVGVGMAAYGLFCVWTFPRRCFEPVGR